jgi:hypothetical protein
MIVAMMVRWFDKNTKTGDHGRKGNWDDFIYMDGRKHMGLEDACRRWVSDLQRRLVRAIERQLVTWMDPLRHASLTSLVSKLAPVNNARLGWWRKAAVG